MCLGRTYKLVSKSSSTVVRYSRTAFRERNKHVFLFFTVFGQHVELSIIIAVLMDIAELSFRVDGWLWEVTNALLVRYSAAAARSIGLTCFAHWWREKIGSLRQAFACQFCNVTYQVNGCWCAVRIGCTTNAVQLFSKYCHFICTLNVGEDCPPPTLLIRKWTGCFARGFIPNGERRSPSIGFANHTRHTSWNWVLFCKELPTLSTPHIPHTSTAPILRLLRFFANMFQMSCL